MDSYPIEVGIARTEDADLPIVSWSAIIAPGPTWDLKSQWDPDAQRLHGITPWQLREGADPAHVMRELNREARNGRVFCDGGHYDAYGLRTLTAATGIEPEFELGDIGELLARYPEAENAFRDILQQSIPPHRAGPDAHRICAALAEAFQDAS